MTKIYIEIDTEKNNSYYEAYTFLKRISDIDHFDPEVLDKEISINNQLIKNIKDLGFTTRTDNALREYGILYVGDLVNSKVSDLLKIPNIGKNSLKEIESVLYQKDLRLNMKIYNWDVIRSKHCEEIKFK